MLTRTTSYQTTRRICSELDKQGSQLLDWVVMDYYMQGKCMERLMIVKDAFFVVTLEKLYHSQRKLHEHKVKA